jgi:hypothetical protein
VSLCVTFRAPLNEHSLRSRTVAFLETRQLVADFRITTVVAPALRLGNETGLAVTVFIQLRQFEFQYRQWIL